MGEVFLDNEKGVLWISSIFVLYGNAADQALATVMAAEVAETWNAPRATVNLKGLEYRVQFNIQGAYAPDISPDEIHGNLDPKMNFFRVEDFSRLHISFVDEIGCNTGYFLYDNLTNHSTTAAHEYGHTLGLQHPAFLDIRGQGSPGIMYPRGTWVDAAFQWDPKVPAGTKGGTVKPHSRIVLPSDIASLRLERLRMDRGGKAVIGDFTNLYHVKH